MDRGDWLVLCGVLLTLAGTWFVAGWAGIVLWAGVMMMCVGVAEIRRGV